MARVSVLRNPWHPAMAIEVQPSLARTGSGYRTRGSQRICKENAGIEPLELPPVAKVSGPMSDMSRRNRSGSRNETIWGELAHVCGRIHHHWFRKNDFVSALKYRRRLLRILQNIPDDDLAIIRQEGLAWLYQFDGEIDLAIQHRRREISLMEGLYDEVRRNLSSGKYDKETAAWILATRDDNCMRERQEILARLLEQIHE